MTPSAGRSCPQRQPVVDPELGTASSVLSVFSAAQLIEDKAAALHSLRCRPLRTQKQSWRAAWRHSPTVSSSGCRRRGWSRQTLPRSACCSGGPADGWGVGWRGVGVGWGCGAQAVLKLQDAGLRAELAWCFAICGRSVAASWRVSSQEKAPAGVSHQNLLVCALPVSSSG